MSGRVILCSNTNCLTAYQEAEAPETCENIKCQRLLFGPTGSGVVCLRDARVSRRGFTANAVTNNTSNASLVESTSLYCEEPQLVDEEDVVVEAAVVEDNEDNEDDAEDDQEEDADAEEDEDDADDEETQEDEDEPQEDEEELQAAEEETQDDEEEPQEDQEELQAADEQPQVDEDDEKEDSSEPEDVDDLPIRRTPVKGSQVVRVAPNAPVKPVRGATRLSKVRAIAAIDVSAEQDEKASDEDVTDESMLDNWAKGNSHIVEV